MVRAAPSSGPNQCAFPVLGRACELSTMTSYLVWSLSRRCDCHTSRVVQRPRLAAVEEARKVSCPQKTSGSSCGLAATPRFLTVCSNHKRSLILMEVSSPSFFGKNKSGFFFRPRRVACVILVARPGIEPAPPVVDVQSLNHWTAREDPEQLFF